VVGDVCPAATMVEVARLVDEAFCIEVEATAVVDD
jgi:enamine deaminase RidA (YjgF/YER057c/UK114 family)